MRNLPLVLPREPRGADAKLALLAPGLYALALLLGTHLPPAMLGFGLPGFLPDKLLHLLAYACLALLAMLGLAKRVARTSGGDRRLPSRLTISVSMILLAALALADEASQPLFGRQFDLVDWVADLAGIALGASLSLGMLQGPEEDAELFTSLKSKDWRFKRTTATPTRRAA